MSLNVKQKLGQGRSPLAISSPMKIESIKVGDGEPSVITLADGSNFLTTCIHCPDQPCVRYSNEEINQELSKKYRVDATDNVCATNAIKWSHENSQPVIAEEDCVLCGVCASRCPPRAIYLSSGGARLAAQPQDIFVPEQKTGGHASTRQILRSAHIKGTLLNESDAVVADILEKIKRLRGRAAKLYPNLLTRNLFRTLGLPSEAYPQGVQYSTVDVLFKVGDINGAAEVELSTAAIDVPRNLAGDVAVLVARHGLLKANLETYSVVGRLPQGREQYWMVIDDMERAIGIKIRTMSILSLYLLTWAGRNFDVRDDRLQLSEKRGVTLRPFLEEKLGRKINLSEGFENQLEPSKLVE